MSQGKKRPRSGSETDTQSAANNDDNEDDDTPGKTMTLLVAPPLPSGATYLVTTASVCLYVCMYVCMDVVL